MNEIWKPIPSFGDYYEASSFGRIRSNARIVKKRHRSGAIMVQHYQSRILSQFDDQGYKSVRFGFDGIKFKCGAHRLVAMAFHGMPGKGQECCHNNGNPSDNRPENLRWDTHLENNRDRKKHGNYAVGSAHIMAKLTEDDVKRIRQSTKSLQESAILYGVNKTTIYKIRSRLSWSHV